MTRIVNHKGRPRKYNFTEENLEELTKFIKDYNKSYNPYPEIRYKAIWEFALHQYTNNNFQFETSYDFWKRKGRVGRKLVDSTNEVLRAKYITPLEDSIDMIHIQRLIENYGGNYKELLWDNLEPINTQINQYLKKIASLEDRYSKEKHIVDKQRKIIEDLTIKNEKLQNFSLSLFTYSNKNNELVNLLNTGQSKSKIINIALEETFENPLSFIEELSNHHRTESVELKNNNQNSNVVSLPLKNLNIKDSKPEYDL